jgi:hypothetical protein
MVKANFFKAIAAGIILYRVVKYIGQQKRSIESWDYRIKGFSLVRIDLHSIEFQIVLDVINKSGAAIKAGMFDLDTILEGIKVGRISTNDFFEIKPYSNTEIPFRLKVYLKDLGTNRSRLIDLLQSNPNFKIELNGTFQVETLPGVYKPVPVDYETRIANLITG